MDTPNDPPTGVPHLTYKEVINLMGEYEKEHESNLISDEHLRKNVPTRIKRKISQYVIGQDMAKRMLSVAAYSRLLRMRDFEINGGYTDIEKTNILMMGPSGCGKTYLLKTLGRVLGIPVAIADATTLTSSGYVGQDVRSILQPLMSESLDFALGAGIKPSPDNIRDLAETGIVYIDEIDKIRIDRTENGRDVRGKAVQEELLKMIEGGIYKIKDGPVNEISTDNILFICGGRFGGLHDIVRKRTKAKGANIGFGAPLTENQNSDLEEYDLLIQTTADDLVEFGLLRELVGRLHVNVALDHLTIDQLIDILTKPTNSILNQIIKLYKSIGIDIHFTPQVIRHFAEKAHSYGTGARALRSVVENALVDIHYRLPNKSINNYTISKKNIRK